LTAVLATGEVIRTGGRLWKDVAGYDLTRLLTGSEGTLAVITEVTVALLPKPATSGTGIAYFDSLAAAGRAVSRVLRGGVVPATLEFLDQRCIDAVERYAQLGLRTDAGALLLFGDDGDESVVDKHLQRIGQACADEGAIEVTIAGDAARSEALLAARRCSLPALSRLGALTILEDASVPRPRLAEMVQRIDAIADKHEVTIATFGHAGDGNLHPTCVLPDRRDRDAIARAEAAFADIFATAMELGGTITGEHGVGAAKLPHLMARLGREQIDLLRRIKGAFDPAGILNPGKLGS
jgi:glycolate oxidase